MRDANGYAIFVRGAIEKAIEAGKAKADIAVFAPRCDVDGYIAATGDRTIDGVPLVADDTRDYGGRAFAVGLRFTRKAKT